MKKILVLGAAGMAGHMIYKYLRSLNGKYVVGATTRAKVDYLDSFIVDVQEDLDGFTKIIKEVNVDVIINCIGLLVKPSEDDPSRAVFLNSFLPHLLENLTKGTNKKVIHLSTDCIFDGRKGRPYAETEPHTEKNWYGRSKSLGELNNDKDLTLRTSICGPEMKDGTGLFHWFSKQKGMATGYNNHYWNGITTLEMAKQIDKILSMRTDLTGIYHLCPKRAVTKGDLLVIIKEVWERDDIEVVLEPAEEPLNKALINNRREDYNPKIPAYPKQFIELKEFQD
jgi:dTDP-4-dehydrorhamnose reductase